MTRRRDPAATLFVERKPRARRTWASSLETDDVRLRVATSGEVAVLQVDHDTLVLRLLASVTTLARPSRNVSLTGELTDDGAVRWVHGWQQFQACPADEALEQIGPHVDALLALYFQRLAEGEYTLPEFP